MQQAVYSRGAQETLTETVRPDPAEKKRAPVDPRRHQREGGFLLLAVLLLMAFMIIAASIEIPEMVQQLKRDREEEMIHRGTEYARAVKKYYKKFGRYPANLEQLDNTNQIRFLRKRYKDPLTKDGKWKTLTYGDILSLLNPNAPGTPAAALGAQGQSAFGQPSAVTSLGTTGSPSSQSPTPSPGNIAYTSSTGFDTNGPSAPAQQTGVTGNTAGGFAGNSPQGNAQQGNSPFNNTFSLGASSGANSNQPGGAGLGTNPAGGNQTFGGGAIVGVASVSKDPTIRIYNKKKTYNEWVFIYNPMMDQQNVLLRGPYQPTTIGGAQVGTPAGQLNNQQTGFGQQPGGFGQQQSGFGQPSTGFGQQQNSPQQTSPVNQFPPDQNQSPH
jgi:type II secretory pathway pseudopilin PulG